MPFTWLTKPKTKKSDAPSRGPSPPKASTQSIDTGNLDLHSQCPTYASTSTKIHTSLLATAMADALAAPTSAKQRFQHEFVTSFTPNQRFNLPPGVWTDNTSMTLCLANSISTFRPGNDEQVGGFDEADQLRHYQHWYRDGHLSAIGSCFDIGNTVKRAITMYESTSDPKEALRRIQGALSADTFGGNGSLTRVLPIGLAYWSDDNIRKFYSQKSSEVTHPNALCVEVCEMWTGAIALILEEMNAPPRSAREDSVPFSKLSLLEYVSNYPYTNNSLRDALSPRFGLPSRPEEGEEREQWYIQYHPVMKTITETQAHVLNKDRSFPYNIPPVTHLPSTGYALHTVTAALYCFFATRTFEEGAIMAANLADDSDAVGALYGGLAGVWYGGEEAKGDRVFWSKRVREWRNGLVKRDLIDEVAKNLIRWEQTLEDL